MHFEQQQQQQQQQNQNQFAQPQVSIAPSYQQQQQNHMFSMSLPANYNSNFLSSISFLNQAWVYKNVHDLQNIYHLSGKEFSQIK